MKYKAKSKSYSDTQAYINNAISRFNQALPLNQSSYGLKEALGTKRIAVLGRSEKPVIIQ
jgi:hypothetical protein